MKRVSMVFACLLFLLALPMWRYLDLFVITVPYEKLLTPLLVLWFALFILLPLKLMREKIPTIFLVGLALLFGALAFFISPTSNMATDKDSHNHCGALTYTGAIYPMRSLLSEAHMDDLEARNQQCWLKKMIKRIPEKFDTPQEAKLYTDLIEKRLMSPEMKYRSSLPFIAVLYILIHSRTEDLAGVRIVYHSLHFWINHYSDEISSRHYGLSSWPHSTYIKFEYGLLEKNWEALINSIVIE